MVIKENIIAIFFLFMIIIAVLFLLIGIPYFVSCKEAGVFNKINGTNYSCSDFFWAREQINTQTQTIKLK